MSQANLSVQEIAEAAELRRLAVIEMPPGSVHETMPFNKDREWSWHSSVLIITAISSSLWMGILLVWQQF